MSCGGVIDSYFTNHTQLTPTKNVHSPVDCENHCMCGNLPIIVSQQKQNIIRQVGRSTFDHVENKFKF